jgi:hypothetical protein
MELKIIGYSARIELVILFLVIGIVLGVHLFCGCTSVSIGDGIPTDVGSAIKEAFSQKTTRLGSDDYGAPLNYNMDNGLPISNWEDAARNYAKQIGSHDNTKSGQFYKSGPIPLPPGELLIFAQNEVHPRCCPSYYSSSEGCVCTAQKQWKYLNERGGNRTLNSEF